MPFLIFYSKNFNSSKSEIFKFVIEKLNEFLAKTIKINGLIYNFKIIGCACDNLGAHELLGMSNFNASHFCRYCKLSKTEVQELFLPVDALERTELTNSQDYEVYQSVKSLNFAHVNGINGVTLLKGISNFDISPFSFISCTSHDIFEKIVPELINTTISRMHRDRILNSDSIYSILNDFKYNSHDRQNPINFLSPLSSLSASQGRMFARTFLLVLKGHLPTDSHLFQGFLHLVRIIDFVMSPFFYKSWTKKLEKEVELLLKFERIELNLDIYPKLHYLMHYPKLIQMYGSLTL